jgi:hypothetical protein
VTATLTRHLQAGCGQADPGVREIVLWSSLDLFGALGALTANDAGLARTLGAHPPLWRAATDAIGPFETAEARGETMLVVLRAASQLLSRTEKNGDAETELLQSVADGGLFGALEQHAADLVATPGGASSYGLPVGSVNTLTGLYQLSAPIWGLRSSSSRLSSPRTPGAR